MNQRKDPYTGEVFTPKRNNQFFATRQNQVAYNNAKARKVRQLHSDIDNHIKKNWQILDDVLKLQSKVTRTKEFLKGAGYNFSLYNSYRMEGAYAYYGVYNYGIRAINDNQYEIIKFKDDE